VKKKSPCGIWSGDV